MKASGDIVVEVLRALFRVYPLSEKKGER